jgi:hypothetical protein
MNALSSNEPDERIDGTTPCAGFNNPGAGAGTEIYAMTEGSSNNAATNIDNVNTPLFFMF